MPSQYGTLIRNREIRFCQHREVRLVPKLRKDTNKPRLKKLGLTSLEIRRQRVDSLFYFASEWAYEKL